MPAGSFMSAASTRNPSSDAVPEPLDASVATTSAPRIISFFCGAGGLDLGFRDAGFDSILAIDSSEAAVATINANSPSPIGAVFDVKDFSPDIVEQRLRDIGGQAPIGIIGGPPCQGFSNGNVTSKRRDPRNELPTAFAKIVCRLAATYPIEFFVFENVTGLLRRQHRRRYNGILSTFRRAGFDVSTARLEASSFGVPQVRERLFIVGMRRAYAQGFAFPTGGISEPRTVADVIRDLPNPVLFKRSLQAAEIPFHPNHWTMVPKSKRFKVGNFNRWRSFRKLEWGAPSPTVAYGNREIHIHPSGKRRLSVLEAMLLQGFPESYVLHGNFSEQVTQVSNAVPPPVALAVASAVRAALLPQEVGSPAATHLR